MVGVSGIRCVCACVCSVWAVVGCGFWAAAVEHQCAHKEDRVFLLFPGSSWRLSNSGCSQGGLKSCFKHDPIRQKQQEAVLWMGEIHGFPWFQSVA